MQECDVSLLVSPAEYEAMGLTEYEAPGPAECEAPVGVCVEQLGDAPWWRKSNHAGLRVLPG